jgi:hypothetical protein
LARFSWVGRHSLDAVCKLTVVLRPWQVYERAIANTPPADEKRYWQRYIYLWINYALFEELEAQDAERTREVYRACLKLIPHKAFTFAKVSPCELLLYAVCKHELNTKIQT